jgi:hypothetical protein
MTRPYPPQRLNFYTFVNFSIPNNNGKVYPTLALAGHSSRLFASSLESFRLKYV